jgi:hypothetical protein
MADTGARLTILNGPLAGRELSLEAAVDNVLIGSDGSCRFHIPTPGISPIHARIWLDAGGVTVYDTHSPRGLYINDDRVNGQAPLKNGDVLWLGTPGEDEAVMIQVRLPPRSAESPAPADRPASDAEPEVVEETVMMSAPPIPPPSEEPDDFAVAEPDDADATVYEVAAEDVAAPPAPAVEDPDATVVELMKRASAPIPPPEDADAFAVAEPEDTEATRMVATAPVNEPVRFRVDLPVAPPPEPFAFEDETTEMTAAAPPVPEAEPEPTWFPPPEPPPAPAPTVRVPVAAAATPPPRAAARPPLRPATPPPAAPRAAPERPPSAAGRYAALAAVAVLFLIGAGFAAWKLLQRPAPANDAGAPETAVPVTQAPAPPSTVARAEPPPMQAAAPDPALEPPVEEAVTIVSSDPPTTLATAVTTPRPAQPSPAAKAATPAPPPTTLSAELARAQQVAALMTRAETAAAAWDYAGASATFDEVLKLEPSNARATEGRAQAQAALAALRKGFVAGRTTVTGGKAAKGGLSGFDSEDVSVAKALDYSGRIDFEASPRSVKPGDSFNVQVYLTNDGKKGFKIGNVTVTTAVNGSRSGGPAAVRERDVEPGARVLLTEVPGTWQASTTSWSLEVVVTSSRNDTFRSQLTWR